jgi:hypothetical protein
MSAAWISFTSILSHIKSLNTTLFIHNINKIPWNLNDNMKIRLPNTRIKPIPGPHTTKDNATKNVCNYHKYN